MLPSAYMPLYLCMCLGMYLPMWVDVQPAWGTRGFGEGSAGFVRCPWAMGESVSERAPLPLLPAPPSPTCCFPLLPAAPRPPTSVHGLRLRL